MLYIKTTTTYINPDGTEEIRDEYEAPCCCADNDAFDNAEQQFRDEILYNLCDEINEGIQPTEDAGDYRYTRTWYADKSHTKQLLQVSLSESQLRETAYNMATVLRGHEDAVYIGQAIVPNKYADVSLTRERLYKLADGTYIKQTAMSMDVDTIVVCETQTEAISAEEALAWCNQHLNRLS